MEVVAVKVGVAVQVAAVKVPKMEAVAGVAAAVDVPANKTKLQSTVGKSKAIATVDTQHNVYRCHCKIIKQTIMAVTSNGHVGGCVDTNAAVPQLPAGGMSGCSSEVRAMAALCNICGYEIGRAHV